jgi:uncharacterized protein (DUF58 family)
MQLVPSRETKQIGVAAIAWLVLGIALRSPQLVCAAAALAAAIALGRCISRLAVQEVRAAGFEMIWQVRGLYTHATRGAPEILRVELRNRSGQAVVVQSFAALRSPSLQVRIMHSGLELDGLADRNEGAGLLLEAGEKVELEVEVTALRVGMFSVSGFSMRVRGAPLRGLSPFEIPLVFANAHGILAFPRGAERGKRMRLGESDNKRGRRVRGGADFRELRDYQPSDALRMVAWRASAKRGRMLVRESDVPTEKLAWIVVEARADLFGGDPGTTAGDVLLADAYKLASRLIQARVRVGLVVFDGRLLSRVKPGASEQNLAMALLRATTFVEGDRTEMSHTELARRVYEHMRSMGSRSVADPSNFASLAPLAQERLGRAPFKAHRGQPLALTREEGIVRSYAAAYGLELPPRAPTKVEPLALALALEHTTAPEQASRRAPSKAAGVNALYMFAEAHPSALTESNLRLLANIRKRGTALYWRRSSADVAVLSQAASESTVLATAQKATAWQRAIHETEAFVLLRRSGVRPMPPSLYATEPDQRTLPE